MEAAPEFFEYLTHPVMVGLAEEVVGGKVRLDESGIIINSALAPGEPGLGQSCHLGAPDHMPFVSRFTLHVSRYTFLHYRIQRGPLEWQARPRLGESGLGPQNFERQGADDGRAPAWGFHRGGQPGFDSYTCA